MKIMLTKDIIQNKWFREMGAEEYKKFSSKLDFDESHSRARSMQSFGIFSRAQTFPKRGALSIGKIAWLHSGFSIST